MRRGAISAVAAIAVFWPAAVAVPAVAVAQPCSRGRAEGSQSIVDVPWERRWLDLDRARSLSGEDTAPERIVVAIVDTGVDGRHPQLAPVVLPGTDLVDGGDGRVDCSGHGTGLASLVAGQPDPAVGFIGVAVRAEILPVRVTDRIDDELDQDRVAAGVDWAVNRGARIVLLTLTLPGDAPAVRAAVARAVERDVLVITSAGSVGPAGSITAIPVPADAPGVLAVAATDAAGMVDPRALPGSHVDIAAPGINVTAAAPARGHTVYSGGDMAAAVVAGVAALVWTRWPRLSAPALTARLIATADPSPGGTGSPSYGAGIVNPVRALSEPIPSTTPAEPAPEAGPRPARPGPATAGPGVVVAALFAVGALAVLGLAAIRRARRRLTAPEQIR